MRTRNQKLIVIGGVAVIVLLALLALVPLFMSLVTHPGVKTDGIDAEGAKPATTDVDGTWVVSGKPDKNRTSVGFTFNELLPGDERTTSGSTQDVEGKMTIESGALTAGEVTVDMSNIVTDKDVRDENVRRKILHTEKYPEAKFVLTEPADVSQLPEDGTVGAVTLTGDLTIHGETNQITQEFNALRTGDTVVVHADVPIKRSDYKVETPEFVAAKIAEDGELNIRLRLEKE
ncbi:YceI family protein [Corynebacterium sp. P3-F1]|uniref:YceI family protein n=1 Tax=Corynebacterium sp. P3-F1 TaxID=3059080 RepID=UPI00265D0967|nr:YceI family protein [Corynebacterium sp. P3-F1]WKK61522.1 YceI family protein [Corynebacterium sp. P3-F1]